MAHSAWDSTKCLQPSSISMCFMCFLGAAVCVTAEPPGGLPGHACLLPAAARPQDSAPQSTPAVSQCPRPCSLPGKATASMPCHLHFCDLGAWPLPVCRIHAHWHLLCLATCLQASLSHCDLLWFPALCHYCKLLLLYLSCGHTGPNVPCLYHMHDPVRGLPTCRQ